MRNGILVMALMLTGCATTRLHRDMTAMQGRNIDEVVKCYGYPVNERSVMGRKLYTWSTASGGARPGEVCTLEFAVDEKGSILSSQFLGTDASCDGFARSWCY
jgi:hypothetical protein